MSGLTGEEPSEDDGVADHIERYIFFFSKMTIVITLKQTYLYFDAFLIICCDQLRCLFGRTLSRIYFKKIIDTIGHFFLSMSIILTDLFALEIAKKISTEEYLRLIDLCLHLSTYSSLSGFFCLIMQH